MLKENYISKVKLWWFNCKKTMQSKDDLDSYKIILEKTVQSHLLTRNTKGWVYFWKERLGKLKNNVTQLSNLSFLFVKRRYFKKEEICIQTGGFQTI